VSGVALAATVSVKPSNEVVPTREKLPVRDVDRSTAEDTAPDDEGQLTDTDVFDDVAMTDAGGSG